MSRSHALSPRSLSTLVSQQGLSEDAARALLNGGRRSRPRLSSPLLDRINGGRQQVVVGLGGRSGIVDSTDVVMADALSSEDREQLRRGEPFVPEWRRRGLERLAESGFVAEHDTTGGVAL